LFHSIFKVSSTLQNSEEQGSIVVFFFWGGGGGYKTCLVHTL